jgi:hypothetical protein
MDASEQATSLTFNYPHQRDISNRLVSFSNKVLGGTLRDKKGFARRDRIFFGLTHKSLYTFEAIRILCERSLVDDAFALVRVLIEGTINASFVFFMNDATANDYADFSDYQKWIQFRDLEKVAPEAVSAVPTAEVEEMKNKYEAVRTRYENNRNGDWHPDPLFLRATKIDAHLGQGYNQMRALVNAPWRIACQNIHGTAGSVLPRITESDSGIVIRRQPKTEEAASVLFPSNMAVFALLALADTRLGTRNKDECLALRDVWRGRVAH